MSAIPVSTSEGLTSIKSSLIRQLQDSPSSTAAESYITHSENEKKCAARVDQFYADFVKKHPGLKHKVSFLQPPNEYNIRKLVCTTIQPTLIPNTELYDLRQCSEFIARFVEYEPLESNDSEQVVVVSPTQTVSWAVGDCFDISVLLASLLIGAGYNAYVVVGTAPAYIRLKDQSHMHCALIDRDDKIDPSKPWSVEVVVKDDCPSEKKNDGLGLHCWVLVKPGKRDLEGSCFVEPSTGIIYPLDRDIPYNEVWCVWNDNNVWVNTDGDDVTDCSAWLQVLPNNAPFSYVSRLEIPRNLFALRHPPSGRKCLLLNKAKIEYFGKSIDVQGVDTRITQFEDEEQILVVQSTELFSPNSRNDHLIQRIRRPIEMICEEKYSIKNRSSVHESSERQMIATRHSDGEFIVRRSIKFHPKSRADGLIERVEDIGVSITETYRHRSDSLIRKVVWLERLPRNTRRPKHAEVIKCSNGLGFAEIIRVDDHFDEPSDKSLLKTAVATRSYRLKEKQIIVTYHCHHEALRSHDVHDKEDLSQQDTTKGQELLKLESASIVALKKVNDDMIELRQSTYQSDLKLSDGTKSDEDETAKTVIPEEDKTHNIEKENEFDYLSPYLAQLDSSNSTLTREEAIQVREACLRGLKERLMERANIMQSRLDQSREQLNRVQEAFQNRRARTLKEQQEFERNVTEESFRIRVMEKRLSEHEDSAIAKYKALEKKLDEDGRLAVLRQRS